MFQVNSYDKDDRKETRIMEFQKRFKSKIILIVKKYFIGLENSNLGKVTKICKKGPFFVTANMGFRMVSNKKNVILTLQSIILAP